MLKLIIICLLSTFNFAINANALPAQVILIRHAEKPIDNKAIDLSEKGFQRAEALSHIFEVHPELTKNGLPIALFASAYVPGSNSKRTIETLTPLSNAIHINIDSTYSKDEYQNLAQMILSNPSFDQKTVMIAWVHSAIVDLAKALGSAPAEQWDDTVFDRIWIIKYDSSGTASSENIGQNLLPGDSK